MIYRCIDLVGSEYIKDIHFYGRTLGRSFLTIGGKVIHLGEVNKKLNNNFKI